MAYLDIHDYDSYIKQDNLSSIIEGKNYILQEALNSAIIEFKSYTNKLYDMDSEFAKTGTDRNEYVKMLLVDMVLYHVHARVAPKMMPEIRKERYDGNSDNQNGGAIGFLKKVAKQITQIDGVAKRDSPSGRMMNYGTEQSNEYYW